ncbi:MAG: TIR domain-containing protein, partial [bacterium]|nr:TIR domain-containing protein [bacterium]
MPQDATRYDVFLSHNSRDKPAVELLAQKLRAADLEPFLDKWHLIPGEPWQEALEEALTASATCAVFLGAGGISPWENEEMRAALEERAQNTGYRVIPTLLPDATMPEREELPRFLRRLTWVDFRQGLEDEDALQRLIAGIRGLSPGAPARNPPTGCRYWNVPHQRNQYFTGREDVIAGLYEALHEEGSAALGQAISGLGGIGKTQTAVEYCYRHGKEYQAVLWTRAETEAELVRGLVEIARVLDLPEKDAQEQEQAVQAVRRWLGRKDPWLLVLDNADTPAMLKPLLPTPPRGHLLLTSRAQNFDMLEMAPLKLEVLPADDALEFLLRRARREDPPAREKEAAQELAEELGYLPLALEQAGAYVSLHDSRFTDYLTSYRRRRLRLLSKGPLKDYREPVATTWSLNFDQVAAASEASAEILRLSACLSPDQIPVEVLIKGAEQLGPTLAQALEGAAEDPLVVDELLQPLNRYSLIERDPETWTFNVHRMVQEVVRQSLDGPALQSVAERIVEALWRADPGADFAAWPLCDRLVPHWRAAASSIARLELKSAAVGSMLNQAAVYAYQRGRYDEAAPLYERSLQILEQVLGAEHPDVANSLNNLASLHQAQGEYAKAAPLLERSLQIREQVL